MALITCSECSNVYSDKADACPSCGCPTSLQPQAREKAPGETKNKANASNTLTSLNAKKAASSASNDKLKLGGIIAIGVGALVALSSGLITGTNETILKFSAVDKKQITRTKSEELAANGFLAFGIFSIIGGAASIMTGAGKIKKDFWIGTAQQASSWEKHKLYYDLIHLAYKDSSIPTDPRASFESSELTNEELIINSAKGERICSFKKINNSNDSSAASWELKK